VEITKSDIIKLVEETKTNSFKTHLLTILKSDFQPAGEFENRKITVWRQNLWNRLYYPIFQFDLDKKGNLVNISDRINPVGKIFFCLFCIVTCIPWFYWIFNDFDLSAHWIQTFTGLIFLGTFILIGLQVYKIELQIQLNQIYELLDMETEPIKVKKEWGWKKVLVRSITYPLSVFLIAVSIFLVLSQRDYFAAIGTLIIVGFYLYSDLKIIIKKENRN